MSASPTVVALVLASAIVHAAWNAILKKTRDPENAVVAVVATAAGTACLVALALGAPIPAPRAALWSIAAGVLEAGYFVTLARALARAPLGPVYTVVRGGGLVIVWPISIILLAEHVSLTTVVGTLLVIAGLASTGMAEATLSSARRLGWAAVCAFFVGGYQVAYKLALVSGGHAAVVVALSLSVSTIVNVAMLRKDRVRHTIDAARAQPLAVILAGTLATLGFVVFLQAMSRAGAGFVVTLRNTSILFAQLFAMLQGDRPKPLGLVGAFLVTLGAVCLAR